MQGCEHQSSSGPPQQIHVHHCNEYMVINLEIQIRENNQIHIFRDTQAIERLNLVGCLCSLFPS